MTHEGYQQPQKQRAREAAFSHAVTSLTCERAQSCCVRQGYVREVRDALLAQGRHDLAFAEMLDDGYIAAWERFHASHVGTRSPADLTVCYLCGPEPLNDFDVLVNLGIHPHNIWAFEFDPGSYQAALAAVRTSRFPHLKVTKGKIEQFFENTPKTFDIIYIDACGPIPSAQHHTLRMISTLLRSQRLASPGALVTNFACPDLGNQALADRYAFLVAAYLYPKMYIEPEACGSDSENLYALVEHGYSFAEAGPEVPEDCSFLSQVSGNLPAYYSHFITRLIFDLAVTIVPWIRLTAAREFDRELFRYPATHARFCRAVKAFGGDGRAPYPHWTGRVREEPTAYPLQWTFLALDGRLSPLPADFTPFRRSWESELTGSTRSGDIAARTAIERSEILRVREAFHSDRLRSALARFRPPHFLYQFCDYPSLWLAFDAVTGQLSYPTHYVVDRVRRWSYRAKATDMFLDALVFDECRYLYEWLPTVDLLAEGLDDIRQQLCYRFALDGLGKHLHWYHQNSCFAGTTVISVTNPRFRDHVLAPRERIT
jgi:hypothetical protein